MISANKQLKSTHALDDDNTLSGRTTVALREAIVNGSIQAGEKLNEPKLAEQFSVSRGPLREAIRRLVSMGLVEHKPHVGASVVTLEPKRIAQLYELREALEGLAARLAASRMNHDEIAELRHLLEVHRQHCENNAGEYMQVEGDFDFHYQIIKGSGNPLLVHQLCDELYHLIRMIRFQTSRFKSRPKRALIEHEQLLIALENRDPELAELLMRRHISRAKHSIIEFLSTEE